MAIKRFMLFTLTFFSIRNSPNELLSAALTHPEEADLLCSRALSLMNVPSQLQFALKEHPQLATQLILQLTHRPQHFIRLFETLPEFFSFLFNCERFFKSEWLPPLLATILNHPVYLNSLWEARFGVLLTDYYFPGVKEWWVNALLTMPDLYDNKVKSLSTLIHLLEIFNQYQGQLLTPVLLSSRRFAFLVRTSDDFHNLQQITNLPSPILQASSLEAAHAAQERELSQLKIRQSARILAQVHRCSNNIHLRRLPIEILGVIAGHCAETTTLASEEKTLHGIMSVENSIVSHQRSSTDR